MKVLRINGVSLGWLAALVAREGKDDVIAFLCLELADATDREHAYRHWCRYHRTSVLRSDLERLKEARPREQQSPLF